LLPVSHTHLSLDQDARSTHAPCNLSAFISYNENRIRKP
jgi:hypothetical protein